MNRAIDAVASAVPNTPIVCDACHSLGGVDEHGRRVGTLGALSTFSFHPVKSVTTAEGGAITTDDAMLAQRMRAAGEEAGAVVGAVGITIVDEMDGVPDG